MENRIAKEVNANSLTIWNYTYILHNAIRDNDVERIKNCLRIIESKAKDIELITRTF